MRFVCPGIDKQLKLHLMFYRGLTDDTADSCRTIREEIRHRTGLQTEITAEASGGPSAVFTKQYIILMGG